MPAIRKSPSGPPEVIIPETANQVINDSSVPGATVGLALDNLQEAIAGILIELPNQNAVIPETNIFPSVPPAGLYAIDTYFQVTTASGTASATARISWVDEAGATNFSSTMFLGQLGRARSMQLVRTDGLSNITYQVLISGNVLLSKYHLSIHAQALT